jgi:hypothetical protein
MAAAGLSEAGVAAVPDKEARMKSSSQGAQRRAEDEGPHSAGVRDAIRGLTKVQRMCVKDGFAYGDITVRTMRALIDKGMFYIHIDSPNGRWGAARLTRFGEAVSAALPPSAGSPWIWQAHAAAHSSEVPSDEAAPKASPPGAQPQAEHREEPK